MSIPTGHARLDGIPASQSRCAALVGLPPGCLRLSADASTRECRGRNGLSRGLPGWGRYFGRPSTQSTAALTGVPGLVSSSARFPPSRCQFGHRITTGCPKKHVLRTSSAIEAEALPQTHTRQHQKRVRLDPRGRWASILGQGPRSQRLRKRLSARVLASRAAVLFIQDLSPSTSNTALSPEIGSPLFAVGSGCARSAPAVAVSPLSGRQVGGPRTLGRGADPHWFIQPRLLFEAGAAARAAAAPSSAARRESRPTLDVFPWLLAGFAAHRAPCSAGRRRTPTELGSRRTWPRLGGTVPSCTPTHGGCAPDAVQRVRLLPGRCYFEPGQALSSYSG